MLAALLLAAAAPADPALFDRMGYRTSHYRAVVPSPPEGTRTLTDREAIALHRRGEGLFIDVMPAEGGTRLDTGHWKLAEERRSIPGARWFPEAGRSPLDPVIAEWFRNGVAALRRNRPSAPLVVFCRADCWMSWNAARRLRSWGVRNILWYGPGTDGWAEHEQSLEVVRPFGEGQR